MNYRHLYHAGNFADVFKHTLLILLLQSLQRKPKPFCYIETHAGRGCYDLTSEEAQKTGEFKDGVYKLWEINAVPKIIDDYKSILHQFNNNFDLHIYPGSPCIAQTLLREQDRMWLCEWQEDEVTILKQQFIRDSRVKIFCQNGYSALKAWLPPLERRGLVFMDPPFEKETEFTDIINGLKTAYRRWATGIYAIWYPIKSRPPVTQFQQALRQSGLRKILITELCIYPDDVPLRLNGSGLVVVNPPWQFAEQVQTFLPWLWRQLAVAQQGTYQISELC